MARKYEKTRNVNSIPPKIIVILGPTASGKSDLAVRLAKEFGGEIVSADSRQAYKWLDIGTGKITKREMAGIPHHLLDVANPKRQFTVVEYVKKASAAVSLIIARGKLPIICGGTAFYIDALLGDATPAPAPPDQELRKKLEKETLDALFGKLRKLDPLRAEKIDAKNRRRLIRAIEIAHALRKVKDGNVIYTGRPSCIHNDGDSKKRAYDALKIGISLPPEELKRRIKKRLMVRMRKGMTAEARRLHENGLPWARMDALGLEYRFLACYLQKQISKQEMLARLETAIWRYAKRQMTWWKRDKEIGWFPPNAYTQIKGGIAAFLKQKESAPSPLKTRADNTIRAVGEF